MCVLLLIFELVLFCWFFLLYPFSLCLTCFAFLLQWKFIFHPVSCRVIKVLFNVSYCFVL